MGKNPFEIHERLHLKTPSLIVGWQTQDVGKLGSRVVDFLKEKLIGRDIGEIKPLGFFSFGGARFKEDLVQVPESKFWFCEEHHLVLFKSHEPEFEHYKFLNSLLDFAERHFQIKELYTLNGAVSLAPHTHPRRVLEVFNHPEIKKKLQDDEFQEMTWEGPPAISSYLLWVARKRDIAGVSLWPEIPFYLAPREDPQAIKLILSFLNRRFDLGLDLGVFDLEIRDQNEKITQLRGKDAEIDKSIELLEKGQRLDEEEQLKLAQEVYGLLGKEE